MGVKKTSTTNAYDNYCLEHWNEEKKKLQKHQLEQLIIAFKGKNSKLEGIL